MSSFLLPGFIGSLFIVYWLVIHPRIYIEDLTFRGGSSRWSVFVIGYTLVTIACLVVGVAGLSELSQ